MSRSTCRTAKHTRKASKQLPHLCVGSLPRQEMDIARMRMKARAPSAIVLWLPYNQEMRTVSQVRF